MKKNSKWKRINCFFDSAVLNNSREIVKQFFSQHYGEEGSTWCFVTAKRGIFHIYTVDDSWMMVARLTDNASIMKWLSDTVDVCQ